jgi:hypothetical protein
MRHKINDFYNSEYFFVGMANVEALTAYGATGRRTGGFLQGMLEGDLYRASACADIENQQRMYHIAKYIVNHLPSESYGTPEKVKQWLTKR